MPGTVNSPDTSSRCQPSSSRLLIEGAMLSAEFPIFGMVMEDMSIGTFALLFASKAREGSRMALIASRKRCVTRWLLSPSSVSILGTVIAP